MEIDPYMEQDLAVSLLSILVSDLGYVDEPDFSIRHAFAWRMCEDILGKEPTRDLVDSFSLMDKEGEYEH